MRTKLDCANDIDAAVDAPANLAASPASEVLSRSVAGFRTIPKQGHVVNSSHVDAIRDEEGI